MKNLVLLISFSFVATSVVAQMTDEQVKTACAVLAEATDKAITANKKSLVVTYCNTFDGLQTEYTVPAGYKTYFSEVKKKYALTAGSWVVSLSNNPLPSPDPKAPGGFTHREVDFIMKMRDNDMINKIDIQQMILLSKLSFGTADDLKVLDKNVLDKLKQNMNTADQKLFLENKYPKAKDLESTDLNKVKSNQ